MKFAISKRRHQFILEVVPEVFSGSHVDFYNGIRKGLKEGRVLMGPFKNYEYVKGIVTPRKTNCNM